VKLPGFVSVTFTSITTALNLKPTYKDAARKRYQKFQGTLFLESLCHHECTYHFNELFHGLFFAYGFTPAAILGIVVPEQKKNIFMYFTMRVHL
jgi:hypothetical protein